MGCLPSKSRVRALITRAGDAEDERRRSQYAFDLQEADLSDNDYLSTKPKSSVTITVRQVGPSVAQKCLDEILPAADDQTAKRGKPIGPVGWGIWKTKKERQTFIRQYTAASHPAHLPQQSFTYLLRIMLTLYAQAPCLSFSPAMVIGLYQIVGSSYSSRAAVWM